MTFDIPWSLALFFLLCMAAIYFGAGIVLGLLSAGATLAVLEHRGATIERHEQIVALLLGAAVGASLNYAVAVSVW